jgi:hypothetical protein
MRKRSGLLSLLSFVVAVSTVWAATRVPADATFRDASFTDLDGIVVYTDRIRSDGEGPYQDEIFCAISGTSGNQYFLRTAKSGCSPAIARALTLDFSQPLTPPESCAVSDAYVGGTLDICGPNRVADVRLVATGMFANAAFSGGTPVTLPFSLAPNFSGPGSFELTFEQNVPVRAGANARSRQLVASATAVAELYQNIPSKGKSLKVSLGRYAMPFALNVEKLQ